MCLNALLVGNVKRNIPRLLINKEVVGEAGGMFGGLDFGSANYRDAKFIGECDQGVFKLAELLGKMKHSDTTVWVPDTEFASTPSLCRTWLFQRSPIIIRKELPSVIMNLKTALHSRFTAVLFLPVFCTIRLQMLCSIQYQTCSVLFQIFSIAT